MRIALIVRWVAAALLFGNLSLSAQEDGWKEIYKDEERTTTVKVASVKATKRGVTAWLNHPHHPPIDVPKFNVRIALFKEKAEYSKTKKWAPRLILFDDKGRLVEDHANPSNAEGLEIIPGTVEEVIAREVWALLNASKAKPKRK